LLAADRKRRDLANALSINTMAARGEEKQINKLLREWGE